MIKTVDLKLNVPLQGQKAGAVLNLPADENGVILDKYWRNRLRDARIDGCVEVVAPTRPAAKKKD